MTQQDVGLRKKEKQSAILLRQSNVFNQQPTSATAGAAASAASAASTFQLASDQMATFGLTYNTSTVIVEI